MEGKNKLPKWAKRGRLHWEYYGQKRPSFAITPKKGEESVWDYPRPPGIIPDSREVLIRLGDTVIVETKQAIRILETASPPTFYLPPSDINFEFLIKSPGTSRCEWKGAATYWDVVTPSKKLEKVGWSYPEPFDEFREISGYLSFYPAHLDCFVDGERVRPQPGGFYGGWITKEIVGPVKGEDPRAFL